MGQKYILALLILVSSACSQTDSKEYELSEELKAKALAVKKEMLEGKTEDISEIMEEAPPIQGENQQNSPAWVLRQVFRAARTGDFSVLSQLCDPVGEIDANTERLCNVANTPEGDQEDFMDYFKLGKIAGETAITGDKATVPMKFGYGGAAEATIKFVRRNGKWYMSSF